MCSAGREWESKEASASFLKKRSKKLLVLRAVATSAPTPAMSKSFLLLFFKKEVTFLSKITGKRSWN
jgi:hypothetical protein